MSRFLKVEGQGRGISYVTSKSHLGSLSDLNTALGYGRDVVKLTKCFLVK